MSYLLSQYEIEPNSYSKDLIIIYKLPKIKHWVKKKERKKERKTPPPPI